MAFVARRNTEGKLVDCQVISGLGTSSMPMSDLSDEDTDSGTVQGYSNRSYVSPTVRYVASKEEDDDLESCYTFDGTRGRGANNLDSDLESVASFDVDRYDRNCKGKNKVNGDDDVGAESDYQLDVASDEETVMQTRDDAVKRRELNQYSGNDDKFQSDDLDSIDGDTVCSPRDDEKIQSDALSVDSFDGPMACHSRMSSNMQPEDAQSLSSIDSVTPSLGPTLHPEDVLSLGSVDSATVCRFMDPANPLDNDNDQADTQSQMTNRTFNLKSSTVRRDDCSSASTCSWTDMYGGALKPSESRSNIVPSLSLNMSTTSSSGSSTYFRNLDEEKERHGQEAYQEWVKRKERQKQQKQQAAKQEREKRDAETAMRQRLAKERYQEWVRQKELQQKKTATGSIKSTASYSSYSSSSSFGSAMAPSSSSVKPTRKETPEATKKRLEEWDRIKTQQQQRERERQRQKQQSKEQLEKQRKQKSEGAWQNWMKSVGNRPKPVPLNQGFDTLRGTISNIYVNPVQWVSNIDSHDSRGN
ncbi:histone-lysine N-methyltransferase, H3 lysine-79 specific [Drosophila montana]|uniref:histone-lysine N-methyltransferase, H3 lysine-79 specific n=1 Tax=Drosophila montana TaxID=40370 RepID=UPI00313E6934